MGLIWLVDDSDLEREVARRALGHQHDVVEFANGEAVLERVSALFAAHAVDGVLSLPYVTACYRSPRR